MHATVNHYHDWTILHLHTYTVLCILPQHYLDSDLNHAEAPQDVFLYLLPNKVYNAYNAHQSH